MDFAKYGLWLPISQADGPGKWVSGKSFGASSISIVNMILRSMLTIVLLANLIPWPLAWWAVNKWLNDFAYRIDQNIYIPLLVMIGALVLCILTVGYHTLRIARSNPVDALRHV